MSTDWSRVWTWQGLQNSVHMLWSANLYGCLCLLSNHFHCGVSRQISFPFSVVGVTAMCSSYLGAPAGQKHSRQGKGAQQILDDAADVEELAPSCLLTLIKANTASSYSSQPAKRGQGMCASSWAKVSLALEVSTEPADPSHAPQSLQVPQQD